ncbi:MAG: hypothetical protein Q8Q35_00005 [Nanoarchaeota archaeon]|nr:hypothetical protein [Nanoarchaeota archaeon]
MESKESVLEAHKEQVRRNRSYGPKFWKYSTLVLLILLIIVLYTNGMPSTTVEDSNAVDKAVSYLNEKLLAGLATAEVVEIFEQDGLYKINMTITYVNGLEEDFTSYVSKDGNTLYPAGLDISGYLFESPEEVVEVTEEEVIAEEEVTEEVPGEEVVVVEETEDLCTTLCETEGFDIGTCREPGETDFCEEDETQFGFDECEGFARCCCA